MDSEKLDQLFELVGELKAELEESESSAASDDLYIPQKHAAPGFNASGLRKLTQPDSGVFRRLLGVE